MRAEKFGTINPELEKEKIKLRAMKFGLNEPTKKVKFWIKYLKFFFFFGKNILNYLNSNAFHFFF